MQPLERFDTCAFVLTPGENGAAPSGMAVTWMARCSHEPPMWSISLHRDCHTLSLIQRSREFVLAIATPELQEAFTLFGTTSGRNTNKFATAGLATAPNPLPGLKSPCLPEAGLNYLCTVANIVPTGDYFLITGIVRGTYQGRGSGQLFYRGKDANHERLYHTVLNAQAA